MRRSGVSYKLHHIGIPTGERLSGERYAAGVGMYTTDDLTGPTPVQWHRFEAHSSIHPLIRAEPHIAYQVSDLEAAVAGHTVILGPYEPIEDYRVAVIDHDGVPIELIETSLCDEELWARAAQARQSPLYEGKTG